MAALTKEQKTAIIAEFARTSGDTGSAEVQIAILSAEIDRINEHLKQHSHDFHTKRGLLKKVGQRRSLLRYLQNSDIERYRNLIAKLGIRR